MRRFEITLNTNKKKVELAVLKTIPNIIKTIEKHDKMIDILIACSIKKFFSNLRKSENINHNVSIKIKRIIKRALIITKKSKKIDKTSPINIRTIPIIRLKLSPFALIPISQNSVILELILLNIYKTIFDVN